MAEYPNNSHNARERQNTGDSPPEKRVEKVVTGAVKARKKSEVKKFAGIFVPEDTNSVKSYILMDVVVPGIKNAIADVVSIILFGESGRIGGKKSSSSKVSYQRYYDDRRDDRKDYNRPRTALGYEYDDIIIESRGEAELVLDQLEEIISTYGMASVADLYDLVGITGRSYTDNKYGWTDIRNAKVVRVRDGYILQLPRALPIG
jgi:hypothetical protein